MNSVHRHRVNSGPDPRSSLRLSVRIPPLNDPGDGQIGGDIADGAEDVGHHLDRQQQGQDLERQAHGQGDGGD